MEVATAKLNEKNGAAMITPIVALLIAMPFLVLLSEFIYLFSMVIRITDYIQEAVVQTAASNAYNAYNGVREGNSSAHMYAGDGRWSEMVSTAEAQVRLKEMLQMERRGNRLSKEKNGELLFAISDIDTRCSNVSVGATGASLRLTFKTTATAEIPISFMGVTITVKKPIALTSYYTPIY